MTAPRLSSSFAKSEARPLRQRLADNARFGYSSPANPYPSVLPDAEHHSIAMSLPPAHHNQGHF
jgi:hypothetical protein